MCTLGERFSNADAVGKLSGEGPSVSGAALDRVHPVHGDPDALPKYSPLEIATTTKHQ
jgi:hypothetical protein